MSEIIQILKPEFVRCKRVLTIIFFTGLILIQTTITNNASTTESGQPDFTITESLDNDQDATIFAAGLKRSGLWKTLTDANNAVLFVPRDTDLEKNGSAFLLEQVLIKPENHERLIELIALHVFPDITGSDVNLKNHNRLSNTFGGCISINSDDTDAITVGHHANVVDHKIVSNGMIYFIDNLLWQPNENNQPCLL